MEATGVHSFQLTDAQGKSHNYVVVEHPAGEGMEIMYQLLSLGSPTVLGLVGAALNSTDLLGAVGRALRGGDSGIADKAALGRQLAGLDLASVGIEVGKALGAGTAPSLTRQVLSRVHRDTHKLDPATFDRAFQANYWELLQLLWRVIAINRFFPVPAISLTDLLGKTETDETETAAPPASSGG
jgi:hypothetical protein